MSFLVPVPRQGKLTSKAAALASARAAHLRGQAALRAQGGGLAFGVDFVVESRRRRQAVLAMGFEGDVVNRHRLAGLLELLTRATKAARGHEVVGLVFTHDRPADDVPVRFPDDVTQLVIIRGGNRGFAPAMARDGRSHAETVAALLGRVSNGSLVPVNQLVGGTAIEPDGSGLEMLVELQRWDEGLPEAPVDFRDLTEWPDIEATDLDLVVLHPGSLSTTGDLIEFKGGGGSLEELATGQRLVLKALGPTLGLRVSLLDSDVVLS